jgi:hypothetical protein
MVAFSLFEWIILGALFFIGFASAGTWAFIKIRNLRWNFNYVVWETVNGADKQEPTKRGKCRLISIGDSGEEIFYLQKLKRFKIAYGKRVGKNTIYWAVGDDGLWYNTEVGNFNNNFRSLGLMPVDRDIRYASTSARKLLDKKYNKIEKTMQTFMIITFVLLIIGIGISATATYFAFSKQSQISKTNNEGLKIQQENAKLFNEAINKLDIVKNGGTGYVTVP